MTKFKLNITADAHDALVQKAKHLMQDADYGPNGTFDITVDPEVYDGLRSIQMEGETISDVIIRLAANTH